MTSFQASDSFGQRPTWLFYVRSTTNPLVGCAQVPTREAAITWATALGWPNSIPVQVKPPYPSQSRLWIEHDFELFGTVIASSLADTNRSLTSYFYRKEALTWARMGRLEKISGENYARVCFALAKKYLAVYRETKGVR